MRSSLLFAAAFMLTGVTAFAQVQTTGTNTVSSTLQVNATVAKAVRLTLATDSGCTVSNGAAPPDYTMDFGTVDALGISAGACGTKLTPTTPGTSPAVYYSSYKLRPTFTSQSATNNTITAYVSTNFSATASGLLSVVQANSSPSLATLLPMSLLQGTQTLVATNAANATDISRYVGISVAPMNGSGTLTGADSATITYTLTVQ